MKRFGYKPLTPRVREKLLGLNGARVYGVNIKQRLQSIPGDYASRLKAKYRAAGASPSNTQYGWVAQG